MKERNEIVLRAQYDNFCEGCIFKDIDECALVLKALNLPECTPEDIIYTLPANNKEQWISGLKQEMLKIGWEQQVVDNMDYDSYWEFYSHLTPHEALMEDMSYGDE